MYFYKINNLHIIILDILTIIKIKTVDGTKLKSYYLTIRQMMGFRNISLYETFLLYVKMLYYFGGKSLTINCSKPYYLCFFHYLNNISRWTSSTLKDHIHKKKITNAVYK